jgi:hypothetical protein
VEEKSKKTTRSRNIKKHQPRELEGWRNLNEEKRGEGKRLTTVSRRHKKKLKQEKKTQRGNKKLLRTLRTPRFSTKRKEQDTNSDTEKQ